MFTFYITHGRGTATAEGDWKFIKGISVHAGNEKTPHGNTQARDGKNTLILLLLSPIKGFFYVLAFPVITIVAVLSGAWTIRKEKQTRLEQEHSRVVAFHLSFIIGLLYVLAFPLIVIWALIKKLALGKMARQKVYSMNTSESVSKRRSDVCKSRRRVA